MSKGFPLGHLEIIMHSLNRQTGWYNGMLLLTLVFAVVLFVSQPWIPLVFGLALGIGLLVGSLVYLAKILQQVHEEHGHRHWVLKRIARDFRPIPRHHPHGPLPPLA